MHRELPVAVLDINPNNASINHVDEVLAADHLPIHVKRDKFHIAQGLDKWFSGRAIPASRSGFRQTAEDLAIQRGIELSPGKLLMECYGLSLSDQYWVSPAAAPLDWAKINFYNNPFSERIVAPGGGLLQERRRCTRQRFDTPMKQAKQNAAILKARCLTTCQAYKATWQKYLSTPEPMKAL